jgi:nitroreductase
MDERIGLLDALYTNRAIRRFRSDAIPEAVISKVIEAATQAPNGSNRQRWRFVVIRDPSLRRRVGDVYRRAVDRLMPRKDGAAEASGLAGDRLFQASWYLAEHMGTEPPILILVCQEGARQGGQVAALLAARSRGASVYPAVQNLLLAARAFGLGGCLTTAHLILEEEVKTILGIPEPINTFALIPLGYPQGRFGALRRRPVRDVTYLDRWDAPFAALQ